MTKNADKIQRGLTELDADHNRAAKARAGKRRTDSATQDGEVASGPVGTRSCSVSSNPKPAMKGMKDRIGVVLKSKAACRKELIRLNRELARLTATQLSEQQAQRYFDEKWLANRWGVSLKHVRKLRSSGSGPLVTYFGRSVRYRLRDVRRYEEANVFPSLTAKQQSTSR